jgi:hypothetical protein
MSRRDVFLRQPGARASLACAFDPRSRRRIPGVNAYEIDQRIAA